MPRGIDRIDLALARHFFDPQADHQAFGILPTPWGVRAFTADRVRRGLAWLQAFWAEDIDPAVDPIWTHLRKRIVSTSTADPLESLHSARHGQRAASAPRQAWRLMQLLRATGMDRGHAVRRVLPQNSVYLNIGQIALAVPRFFQWLEDRADIAAIFMLHDVIPIQYPELVSRASATHHGRMVDTAARFADGLIVSTTDAAAGIWRELARRDREDIPTLVRHLPLSRGFMRDAQAHPALAGLPYLVVCGSIEPRKNHALLIDAWQQMIQRDGLAAPHLVIIGTPGWSAGQLFDQLESRPLLRSRIHHAAGLSTPALAQLIAGAAGLLVPSLAEGFSLPLLEARALGVPVLASDIAVHRERADAGVVLLPTGDADAWVAAIDALPGTEDARGTPLRMISREAGEDDYCRDVATFLERWLEGGTRTDTAEIATKAADDAPPALRHRSRAARSSGPRMAECA